MSSRPQPAPAGRHGLPGFRRVQWLLAAGLLALTQAASALTNPSFTDSATVDNNAVVRFVQLDGSGSCTGVLVSANLVLTAGHCVQGAVWGHEGPWPSRPPLFREFFLPTTPSPDWVSGLRGGSGMLERTIILPFNYESPATDRAEACQAACNGDSACQGWTFLRNGTGSSLRCWKKQAVFKVRIGTNLRDGPATEITARAYSFPGPADIGVLRLDRDVPASVARPARVMSHLFDNVADIDTFLRAQSYEAVGFTHLQLVRRRAPMAYARYPNGGDIAQMFVARATGSGSVLESGDSGSPLFLLRTLADGSTQRFVVGIAQGPTGTWNRYTLTGINVFRYGVPVVFPYDPATIDPAAGSVLVGEWLNNVMYADHAQRHITRPLYQWWSSSQLDNFLTSDTRWASDPRGLVPEDSGRYFHPYRQQNGDYRMFRLEGHVFDRCARQPAGTVPLWSWFSAAHSDNMATTAPEWSGDPTTVSCSLESFGGGRELAGYRQYRLEGFVYDPTRPQPAQTAPLLRWASIARNDQFTTSDAAWQVDLSTLTIAGGYVVGGPERAGYRLVRVEGYVPLNAVPR